VPDPKACDQQDGQLADATARLARLGHCHLARPLFPFDPDMPDPDLRAVLV
jgi:hypothetical protein